MRIHPQSAGRARARPAQLRRGSDPTQTLREDILLRRRALAIGSTGVPEARRRHGPPLDCRLLVVDPQITR
jgi:hypothetical protein